MRPSLLLLDVNETISDLAPMAARFAAVGAPGELGATWFVCVLRDGIALSLAGTSALFADLAADHARRLLAGRELECELDAAVAQVVAGFATLGVHRDVVRGLRGFAAAGLRVATLSNGASAVAQVPSTSSNGS